jgi:hypothetical protein
MKPALQDLYDRIRHMEEEVEAELKQRRAALNADFEHRRVQFEAQVLAQQAHFRQGLWAYLGSSELRNVVTAPLIYPVLLPLLLVDLAVSLYQWACFPLYRIARVRRRDHFVFDRGHLAYLNLVEKINCAYCSYANGLASYVREVVGRTEQYWCPIKHARRVLQAHPHYRGFVDYGDAQAWRRELQQLRAALARLDDPA